MPLYIRQPTLWANYKLCKGSLAYTLIKLYVRFFTTSKQVTKAGVTVYSAMSAKTCSAVFVHLLAISHLRRRLRTYQSLRGNTGCCYCTNLAVGASLHISLAFAWLRLCQEQSPVLSPVPPLLFFAYCAQNCLYVHLEST